MTLSGFGGVGGNGFMREWEKGICDSKYKQLFLGVLL